NSIGIPPQPLASIPKRVARRISNDERVLVHDFFKVKMPKLKGEEKDDSQEFLEEIEKMIKRLLCSDAKVIVRMKRNVWDWFQRNIKDQLYGTNPPTCEVFKQALIYGFLSLSERQNRALQFENLKQTYCMSVFDYARKFI